MSSLAFEREVQPHEQAILIILSHHVRTFIEGSTEPLGRSHGATRLAVAPCGLPALGESNDKSSTRAQHFFADRFAGRYVIESPIGTADLIPRFKAGKDASRRRGGA